MSAPGERSGFNRREVAYRVFAVEYDDARLEFSEEGDDRAPNYVVTPGGARLNRVFVVGVLTEVDTVGDGIRRARIADPTGTFVGYAGQYQPEAAAFLDRSGVPSYVAVTGKARTFRPDDADRVYTSIRPESIAEVDAATRDRWIIQAAEHTIDRIGIFAAALDRPERGGELRALLRAADVEAGIADGIPRAIDEYGTTPAYLAALRRVAIQAVEVVAGERSEVESIDIAPDEEQAVEGALGAEEAIARLEAVADREPVAVAAPGGESSTSVDADESDEPEPTGPEPTETVPAESVPAEDSPDADGVPADDPTGGRGIEDTESDPDATHDVGMDTPAAEDDLYEFDDGERAAIEEEYGADFSPGTEVDDPDGDRDESPPEADEPADDAGESDGADEASEATESLEDAVVDAMRSLDDGEGADRTQLIEAVEARTTAGTDAIDEAIHDALMSGRCYEPTEGRLKAI